MRGLYRAALLCTGLGWSVILGAQSTPQPGAQASTASDTPPPLTVTTTLSTLRVFVNEQVLLHRQVVADNAAFNITGTASPAPEHADVLQLASQKRSTPSHQETNTYWSIFSRSPGMITIAPHLFQATMPASGGTNPLIKARSTPLTLEVLPIPPAPPGAVWLPAQSATISQQWVIPGALIIGEPKTLEVRITVSGQRAAAIAPLAMPKTEGLRWYRTPAELNDKLSASGITGTRTERFTVLAQNARSVELPPFKLAWFDTTQRQWHEAKTDRLALSITDPSGITQKPPGLRQFWRVLTIFSVLAGCLFLLYRRLRPSESVAWRRVKRAYRRNDVAHLRRTILDWARLRWPTESVMGLEQLASVLTDPNQKQAVLNLNAAAFGRPDDSCARGNHSLMPALRALRNRGQQYEQSAPSLTPLYPPKPGVS